MIESVRVPEHPVTIPLLPLGPPYRFEGWETTGARFDHQKRDPVASSFILVPHVKSKATYEPTPVADRTDRDPVLRAGSSGASGANEVVTLSSSQLWTYRWAIGNWNLLAGDADGDGRADLCSPYRTATAPPKCARTSALGKPIRPARARPPFGRLPEQPGSGLSTGRVRMTSSSFLTTARSTSPPE